MYEAIFSSFARLPRQYEHSKQWATESYRPGGQFGPESF
jgi:hypothetical protein